MVGNSENPPLGSMWITPNLGFTLAELKHGNWTLKMEVSMGKSTLNDWFSSKPCLTIRGSLFRLLGPIHCHKLFPKDTQKTNTDTDWFISMLYVSHLGVYMPCVWPFSLKPSQASQAAPAYKMLPEDIYMFRSVFRHTNVNLLFYDQVIFHNWKSCRYPSSIVMLDYQRVIQDHFKGSMFQPQAEVKNI